MKHLLKIILLGAIAFVSTSCSWLNEEMDSGSQKTAEETQKSEEKAPQMIEDSESQSPQNSVSDAPETISKEQVSNVKIDSHYGILIEELGMQNKKLRAELDFLSQEIYFRAPESFLA